MCIFKIVVMNADLVQTVAIIIIHRILQSSKTCRKYYKRKQCQLLQNNMILLWHIINMYVVLVYLVITHQSTTIEVKQLFSISAEMFFSVDN